MFDEVQMSYTRVHGVCYCTPRDLTYLAPLPTDKQRAWHAVTMHDKSGEKLGRAPEVFANSFMGSLHVRGIMQRIASKPTHGGKLYYEPLLNFGANPLFTNSYSRTRDPILLAGQTLLATRHT